MLTNTEIYIICWIEIRVIETIYSTGNMFFNLKYA